MKKAISFFQKYSGYISIVVFALLFVYALGMATPTASCLEYKKPITEFYSDIMPINDGILYLSIAGLFISAFYFVLRNNVRVIYYISNFVWYGLYGVFSLASAIFTFVGVATYQSSYNELPFEQMNEFWERRGSSASINPNTPVFLLGYILAILIILTLIPYVLVIIDKIKARLRYENNKKNGIENPVTYDPKEAN